MREDFDAKLASYVEGCKRISGDHTRKNFPNLTPDAFTYERKHGQKRVRVVHGGSVHSFVDIETGDVLKAESWAKPAKHARGNIFDADNGLGRIGPYGPAYLR